MEPAATGAVTETGADTEAAVTESPVESYPAGAPAEPAVTEAPIGHAATETAMAAEAAEVLGSAAAGAPAEPATTEAPIGHAATETAMAAEAAEVLGAAEAAAKPGPAKAAARKPAARAAEVPAAAAPVGEAGPPIANYGELSIASLRARLRGLTVVQVREVIAYERANANRPEVIAMFERRMAKLEAPEG